MKEKRSKANPLPGELDAEAPPGPPGGEITIDRKQLVSYDTTEIRFTIPGQ